MEIKGGLFVVGWKTKIVCKKANNDTQMQKGALNELPCHVYEKDMFQRWGGGLDM